MGFFSTKKKKAENVKTLTETEIQQRLYGHLRVPSTAVEDSGIETARQTSFTPRRPTEPSKDLFNPNKAAHPATETSKAQEASGTQKTISSNVAAGVPPQRGGWNDSSSHASASFSKTKIQKQKNAAFLVFLSKFIRGCLESMVS